jgi:N-acetylmuramoyl-L-alanine amidase
MPNARELVSLLLKHQGERYILGSLAPKTDPNYQGPWDCAEFVAWGIYQVTGQYIGCRGRRHDAYTGYFADDLPRVGSSITEDEAAELIGAVALRLARHGRIGHIAVSRGGDRTIEAAGSRLGVTSRHLRGRGYDQFYTLNCLTYEYVCSFL